MIGRSGERGSGISVLAARHDDIYIYSVILCKNAKSARLRICRGYDPHKKKCSGYDTKMLVMLRLQF